MASRCAAAGRITVRSSHDRGQSDCRSHWLGKENVCVVTATPAHL